MSPERCPGALSAPRATRGRQIRIAFLAGAIALVPAALSAQARGAAPTAPQRTPAQADSIAMLPTRMPLPAADPKDVESIDAILAALYDVISGDAGVKRDWDRFRSLFVQHARLVPTGRRQDGTGGHRVMTPEGYIQLSGAALEDGGFHEREIGRRMDRYGNIVHVFSAYDSKRTVADAQPFARGINSIQLWNDGRRWWVVSIFWEAETPQNPIPAEMLRSR
jgi:hypothetical protein